jgi:hypothetical protein
MHLISSLQLSFSLGKSHIAREQKETRPGYQTAHQPNQNEKRNTLKNLARSNTYSNLPKPKPKNITHTTLFVGVSINEIKMSGGCLNEKALSSV